MRPFEVDVMLAPGSFLRAKTSKRFGLRSEAPLTVQPAATTACGGNVYEDCKFIYLHFGFGPFGAIKPS